VKEKLRYKNKIKSSHEESKKSKKIVQNESFVLRYLELLKKKENPDVHQY